MDQAFQNLRQGNPVYILYKGENPRCDVTYTENVSTPEPKFKNQINMYQPNQEMVVNLKIKIQDVMAEIPQVPANLSITNYTLNGQPVVISSSRDAINTEIDNMLQQRIVDSVDYHQSIIAGCESMLEQLNPSFAEKKQQEEKIGKLEEKVAGIENGIQAILEKLSTGSSNNPSSKNPKNN